MKSDHQVRGGIESVVLEVSPQELFVLATLQYRFLGGLHAVRTSIEAGLDDAFASVFPGINKHGALSGPSNQFARIESILLRIPPERA